MNLTQFYEFEHTLEADETMQATKESPDYSPDLPQKLGPYFEVADFEAAEKAKPPVWSEEVCFEQFVNFMLQKHTSMLEDDIGNAFDSVAPPGGCLSRADATALEQRIQKELK